MTNPFVVTSSRIQETLLIIKISIALARSLSNRKLSYLIRTECIMIEKKSFCTRAFALNILIHLINRSKRITSFSLQIESEAFSFLSSLNATILFLKTRRMSCILFISSLIWMTTCATSLSFRLSMMFLSKCFIIMSKSRTVDLLTISFAFETGLEAKLMMIDVSAFWFWLISFKTCSFRRPSFDWVMNLTLMISKASRNSKTR